MLREFRYKDKNRKVLVTNEDKAMLEGVDFSYATEDELKTAMAFIEKYDGKKKLVESEMDPGLSDEEKKKMIDQEKSDWAPYMKFFRRYLKASMSPKVEDQKAAQ